MLMGRVFSRPERFRMYFKQYLNEMVQLGINSIGIVLLISFFIGAVICIQIKLNIESPWMPRFVVGYTTREILLLEFSSSIMCLILAGKVGSNIASEIGILYLPIKYVNRENDKIRGKNQHADFLCWTAFFSVRQTDFGMESPHGCTCHMMADVL